MEFPVWIIAVVVAIVVVLFSLICYLIISRRRRNASPTIDVVDTVEKARGTTNTTTLNYQQEKIPLPTPPHASPKGTMPDDWSLTTPPYSEPLTDETNDSVSLPPSRRTSHKQQYDSNRTNLPLPPPSTSLFSDKMELSSDEAMELFDKYVNVDLDKSATATGGFTANFQQKAATLRSTMRQSLRRQKSTSKSPTPLQNLFDSSGSRSETTSTTGSTPSLVEKHPVPSIRTTNTDRSIMPGLPTPTMPNTPVSRTLPQTPLPTTGGGGGGGADVAEQWSEDPPPSPPPTTSADGAAMHAARRIIRTASRKSRTKSMLVNEDDVMKMFDPETATAAAAAAAAKTVSVRKHVRDNVVHEKSASVSGVRSRGANSAAGTSVRHLAERWNNHAMPNTAATVAGRVQQQTPRASAQDLFESRKPKMTTTVTTQKQQQQQEQEQQEDNTNGNVDNVRKMLQATWQANLRESGSMASIVSTTEAAVTAGSNHHSGNVMRQNPILRNSTQTTLQDITVVTAPQQQQQQASATAVSSPAFQEKIEIEETNFAMGGYHNRTWNAGRRPTTKKNVDSIFQNSQDTTDFFGTTGRRQSSRQQGLPTWSDDMTSSSNNDGNKTAAQRERDNYRTIYQQSRA